MNKILIVLLSILSFNIYSMDINKEIFNAILHHAAQGNNIEEIKSLIKASPNVNSKDEDGETALHCAAYFGFEDIITLLISRGANVNAKNNEGKTPLFKATFHSVIELLLEAGADINSEDIYGKTALHFAVYRGNKVLVQLLISCGANVNAKLCDGCTPLHEASYLGHSDIVKLLLDADISHYANASCGMSGTVLSEAFTGDRAKVGMSRGMDKNIKNNENLTAADMARTAKIRATINKHAAMNLALR